MADPKKQVGKLYDMLEAFQNDTMPITNGYVCYYHTRNKRGREYVTTTQHLVQLAKDQDLEWCQECKALGAKVRKLILAIRSYKCFRRDYDKLMEIFSQTFSFPVKCSTKRVRLVPPPQPPPLFLPSNSATVPKKDCEKCANREDTISEMSRKQIKLYSDLRKARRSGTNVRILGKSKYRRSCTNVSLKLKLRRLKRQYVYNKYKLLKLTRILNKCPNDQETKNLNRKLSVLNIQIGRISSKFDATLQILKEGQNRTVNIKQDTYSKLLLKLRKIKKENTNLKNNLQESEQFIIENESCLLAATVADVKLEHIHEQEEEHLYPSQPGNGPEYLKTVKELSKSALYLEELDDIETLSQYANIGVTLE